MQKFIYEENEGKTAISLQKILSDTMENVF